MKKEKIVKKKKDRRLLTNVPDPTEQRQELDRRMIGNDAKTVIEQVNIRKKSARYETHFPIHYTVKGVRQNYKGLTEDISPSGLLMQVDSTHKVVIGQSLQLQFKIPEDAMPEGYESRVRMKATVVRLVERDGETLAGIVFEKTLNQYFRKRRWRFDITIASIFLLFVSLLVLFMRVESVVYFKYNKWLYFYSMLAAFFLLSRYFYGSRYRPVPIHQNFQPGVSIIIPCFNEEQWIDQTIKSCIGQYYPIEQLEIIIVDDCSNDRSVEKIEATIDQLKKEAPHYSIHQRVQTIYFSENKGKREALVAGVHASKFDYVVFVDSDSVLDPDAIYHLVQPFQDPQMGGVAGRTDVLNKYTNSLTKLQTVRYYVSFRIMKAAESYFDAVTCLSGPLSCYRKELIEEHEEAWLNQTFLGQPATFGDDRSMTNFILKTHRTSYQDTAICSTIVPSDFSIFLKQQMRWKRSWLRESLRALSFILKKEPLMALFFIVGLIVPILAPIVVVYNLIYVPLAFGVFPTTFMIGLTLMAAMMSFAHLFFNRSPLWIFGFVFVLFYEFVLLWQMPVAWFTFWKSTWGTRETPQDIKARERKIERKKRGKRDE